MGIPANIQIPPGNIIGSMDDLASETRGYQHLGLGAVELLLAIAAHAHQIVAVVPAAAFADRPAMVDLGGDLEPAAFALWHAFELLGTQLDVGHPVAGAVGLADRKICLERFDARRADVGLDHSSQFVADDFQTELAFLGIESSPAFVLEPEGNGCVERFIRTLKENLLWVPRFATIGKLRQALHAFKDTYNQT